MALATFSMAPLAGPTITPRANLVGCKGAVILPTATSVVFRQRHRLSIVYGTLSASGFGDGPRGTDVAS